MEDNQRCLHYKRHNKSHFLTRCSRSQGHKGQHLAELPHEFGDGTVSWRKESSSMVIKIKGNLSAPVIRNVVKIQNRKRKDLCPYCQPFGNGDWALSQCYLPKGHDGEHCAGVPIEFDGSYPGDSVVHWESKEMIIMVVYN